MTEPEDTDIQRLIRLKKYEQPPEGFVEDFLAGFHHRQRLEILNNSSTSLFWERLVTFMQGRVNPGMGLAGAVAAVLLVGGAVMWVPHGGAVLSPVASAQALPEAAQNQVTAINNNRDSFTVSPFFGVESEDRVVPHMRPAELANFLSEHFRGGFADEQLYKVNGWLDQDVGRFSPAPLLNTPQNGSAKNIQRQ